jgi:hypothetical protein
VKEPSPDAQARAARLVRWYPKEWRTRYGDEFRELLVAQIADQPRSRACTLDVAFGAIMARLAAVGLSGTPVDPSDQARRSLATLGSAAAIFLTFAISIWSHLTIARRSAAPATTATHTAIIIMTTAVTICIGAAVVGSIPLAWTATRAAARRSDPRPRRGALLFLTGLAVLIAGGLAFHGGWSGTGTHPWSQQSTGPSGPSNFLWTSTLSVSAYWAHPTILLSLPASEIAWMVISPLALIVAVVGAAKTVRRLDMSTRLLRFVTRTAQLAIAGSGLFLFGTLTWLVDGGPGPARLFQAGTVDQIGLVVMTAALLLAIRTIQRAKIPAPLAR